jgi:hypothetical protein
VLLAGGALEMELALIKGLHARARTQDRVHYTLVGSVNRSLWSVVGLAKGVTMARVLLVLVVSAVL